MKNRDVAAKCGITKNTLSTWVKNRIRIRCWRKYEANTSFNQWSRKSPWHSTRSLHIQYIWWRNSLLERAEKYKQSRVLGFFLKKTDGKDKKTSKCVIFLVLPNFSKTRTIDRSNVFLGPVKVRVIESQLYFKNNFLWENGNNLSQQRHFHTIQTLHDFKIP